MRTLFIAVTAAAAIALSPITFAHSDGCEHTELGETMDQVKDNMRALGNAAKSDDFAGAEEAIAVLMTLADEGKAMTPMKASDVSDKESFMSGYVKGMEKFEGLLAEAMTAAKAEDKKALFAALGKMDNLRKSSHRDYKKDC